MEPVHSGYHHYYGQPVYTANHGDGYHQWQYNVHPLRAWDVYYETQYN